MSQENVWLCVFVLAGALAAGGLLFLFVRRGCALRRNYGQLAEGLAGSVDAGSWLDGPALSFVHQEMPALLTAANDIVLLDSSAPSLAHSLWHTQLHIGWPDPEARCEIFSRRALSRFLDEHTCRFETGCRAFDGRYLVRGDSLHVLREFLSEEVQLRIQGIRFLGDNNDVYVGLGGGVLTIRKQGVIRDLEALQKFTRLGLELFDIALRGERAGGLFARRIGIEFLQERGFFLPHGARCPLCGDEIEGEVVYCRACRTPHHAECWRYLGACSTYGCSEEQFTAVVSFGAQRESITIGDESEPRVEAAGRCVRLRSCRESARGAKVV